MPENQEYLVRPRINALLTRAIKMPVTIMCGSMGCGKTRAVCDFIQQCDFPVIWLSFCHVKNSASHFWSMFVRAISQINEPLATELGKLGLPDTADKMNIYLDLQSRMQLGKQPLYVFDDFHLLQNPAVLSSIEQAIVKTEKRSLLMPVILISREFPSLNISSLMLRNKVSVISEEELNFTEDELRQFLQQQGLNSETSSLSKIHRDTRGWAFIISFAARMLQITPGYDGYVRTAIRQDIIKLIKIEVWDTMPDRLKRLFLRLSLTAHRSMDLVNILAGGDEGLISEFLKQNIFVHCDKFINAYHVHHLFYDFLRAERSLLSNDEIRDTHKKVASWCLQNDFIVDALFEYEKIGDYEAIVSILFTSWGKFFEDHARYGVEIFRHAPKEVFDRVEFSAAMHIQLTLCTRQWRETLDLIQFYEAKYLRLPADDAFRNRMLGCVYYYWGILRVALCSQDDRYDFDTYFAKQYACLKDFPINPKCWYPHHPGVFSCLVSSDKAGATREYLDAVIRGSQYQQDATNGLTAGIGELCQSELLFHQGDMPAAEFYAIKAIDKARERGQHEIAARALFYLMRIAVFQGDYQKLELSRKDAEKELPYNKYSSSFLTYDIILGLYYYILGQAEEMPAWLKEGFVFPSDKTLYENFGNYIKARYCYLTKNYANLLAYLQKEKQRKIALLERVELLTVEACLHMKINSRKTAVCLLQEAYQLALPDGIVSPFIELGKDMRTLVALTAKCSKCVIPLPWLKSIHQQAGAYARNQALIVSKYNKIHGIGSKITLSPREIAILHDLRDGLSRSETAAKRGLSLNTVKMHINNIYHKLGAQNRADMLRIVAENNIV